MRFGVRLKLFLMSLVSIALCVAVADAVVTRAVSKFLLEEIRDDLLVRSRLVAREASSNASSLTDLVAWDALADGQGSVAGARVTLLARDGTVLGDSDIATAHLPDVENHGQRPEVVRALSSGYGEGSRLSVTVHEQMLYMAVPFERSGQVVGVARLAKRLDQVEGAVASARRIVFAGSIVAVVLAVVVSFFAAQRISRTIRDLTDVALRMTKGDLTVRTGAYGNDELAELGRALDHLATSLAKNVAELREERDLLGGVLEHMQEGVLVLDSEGRVLTCNPALRGMLLVPDDGVGKRLVEVVENTDLQEFIARAQASASSVSGEIAIRGAKSRKFLVHVARMSGDELRWLAVFVDVTELRRLESVRRDFVANVSHELRTPVAAVRSAAETLTGGALEEPLAAQKFVGIIDRHAQRLQALIDDLLDISRLESKEFRLKIERFELEPVVVSVLALFRERAERKGVELQSQCEPSLFVEADLRAVEHVLSNLVDNAVKYAPSGARVSVVVAAAGEGVRFTVSDTGPGIDAKHLPRLFERFYRVDRGRSRDVGGTGLGLSIVKHLSEAMGGSVEVTSELGKGSTFIVRLPRKPAAS